MATLYTNRNDNAGAHVTVNAIDGTTWQGGSVPLVTDDAVLVGRRTTWNSGSVTKWTGTRTCTVGSTTGFATSGFFYTVTSSGEIVKVNYTGITSTTFTGCSVDETDSFYSWVWSGSIISNGNYVHNPAYVVTINAGETFECNILYIQEGGWLLVNGGTLKVNTGIIHRDGRLMSRNGGQIIISRTGSSLSGSFIGYLEIQNYQLSVVDIDGGENRVHSYTTAAALKGDISVTIDPLQLQNGNFAVGDEVSLYKPNDYRRRNVGYTGYRDITTSFKYMDEGFDVCGVSGNNIYLALRNGAKGTIKTVETVGSQKIIGVYLDNIGFSEGDILCINNTKYTIDAIEDGEVTVYDYDFTSLDTSLSDFWVNDSTHIYSGNWYIQSGVGLKNTSGSYRELVHKFLWTRDVVIEAEMSPLASYYTGSRGTGGYGILSSYDPAFRWGHRGYDSFKSDYFIIDDANDVVTFNVRSVSNYQNNRLSRNTALRTKTRGPVKYRLDNRKYKSKTYIDDLEFSDDFRRDGNYKGLVGIFSNGNTNFVCKRLTIKLPLLKLYLTTTDNFSVNDVVYRLSLIHI